MCEPLADAMTEEVMFQVDVSLHVVPRRRVFSHACMSSLSYGVTNHTGRTTRACRYMHCAPATSRLPCVRHQHLADERAGAIFAVNERELVSAGKHLRGYRYGSDGRLIVYAGAPHGIDINRNPPTSPVLSSPPAPLNRGGGRRFCSKLKGCIPAAGSTVQQARDGQTCRKSSQRKGRGNPVEDCNKSIHPALHATQVHG